MPLGPSAERSARSRDLGAASPRRRQRRCTERQPISVSDSLCALRARAEITSHFAAGPQARWRGASDEQYPARYVRSEQQSQRACGPQPGGARRRAGICFVAAPRRCPTSTSSRRLASARPALAPKCEFISARALRVKPLALLIPGLDGTGRLYYRQIDSLSQGNRARAWEFKPRAHFTFSDLVDELAEGTSGEEPKSIAVVGESFGGTVAMHFALAFPERIRCLVLINSFAFYA